MISYSHCAKLGLSTKTGVANVGVAVQLSSSRNARRGSNAAASDFISCHSGMLWLRLRLWLWLLLAERCRCLLVYFCCDALLKVSFVCASVVFVIYIAVIASEVLLVIFALHLLDAFEAEFLFDVLVAVGTAEVPVACEVVLGEGGGNAAGFI